jgi:hypothetical protein
MAHWLTELRNQELLRKLEQAVGAGAVSALAQCENFFKSGGLIRTACCRALNMKAAEFEELFMKMQETLAGDK